ncbi:MAG: prepilin-type N-terminal cleavage/methylation domain-containing protein [Candidatus Ozemobacteraceae bacterium]
MTLQAGKQRMKASLRFRVGFTLIELLVAIICLALLLLPAYQAFLVGTRTSLVGMLQVETTMEARRALRQIHADLKAACMPFDDRGIQLTLENMLFASADASGISFAVYVFPRHVDPSKTITVEPSGLRPHLANFVTYRLRAKTPGDPRKELIREERPHPATGETLRTSVLSDRVNHFEIRTVHFLGQTPRSAFFVTLQLVDTIDSGALSNLNPSTAEKPRGVVLADYCDMVAPTFLSSMLAQEGVNRTWYSELRGPP